MNLIELATHTQNTLEQMTERVNTLAAEHTEALAAKDAEIAELTARYTEKVAYQADMEAKVTAVLQSGDPAQYEALATEFLTPAQETARLAKLARIEELKAEAAALEAEV
jgi:phage shock protein A